MLTAILIATLTIVPCLEIQQHSEGRAETCLRWDAVPDAAAYRIYGRQTGTVEWQVAGEASERGWCPVKEIELEIPYGVQVEFVVRAVNAEGESPGPSNIVDLLWPPVCVASDRAGICACFTECEP